jgi:hypothetical protein
VLTRTIATTSLWPDRESPSAARGRLKAAARQTALANSSHGQFNAAPRAYAF